jgi:(p)ppGpp synthase/HD superfamily hydrolase
MNMLAKAIAIASTAFEDKVDKGGSPYILHCLRVMDAVEHLGEEAEIVAILHDLIEDTDWTAEMLIEAGFTRPTVEMIKMMTHAEGEPYDDYIARVALNKITRRVKMADLKDNSNIHRMKGLREKDFKRLEKYFRSYAYLKEWDND